MAGLAGIPLMQIKYDTERYPFKKVVEETVGCCDLPGLHRSLGSVALVERASDQGTVAHRRFYEHYQGRFMELYREFVAGFVQPLLGETAIFQTRPTFRVHFPGNLAVGEWHRDTDYNHNPEAITFWVPVTDAYGTNTLQVELGGAKREVPAPYGNAVIFDSMGLLHGNEVNTTSDTRVSFDFRVIPESQFVPSDRMTLNTGMKMEIGGYYDRLD